MLRSPGKPKSLRKVELETGVPKSLVQRIIKKNSSKIYKSHIVHNLLEDDPDRRTQLKSKGLTVWAAVSCNGVLSYDISHSTMTGNRCEQVLNEQVSPHFTVPEVDQAIFQQDGAPPHFANPVKRLLNDYLHCRWIGHGCDFLDWPPRSPDLTVNNDEELKQSIEEELLRTPQNFFAKAYGSSVCRCGWITVRIIVDRYCRMECNGNLPEKAMSSSVEDLSDYTDADESISAPTEILAELIPLGSLLYGFALEGLKNELKDAFNKQGNDIVTFNYSSRTCHLIRREEALTRIILPLVERGPLLSLSLTKLKSRTLRVNLLTPSSNTTNQVLNRNGMKFKKFKKCLILLGKVRVKRPSLIFDLGTNGLKVTSEPPSMAVQAGCLQVQDHSAVTHPRSSHARRCLILLSCDNRCTPYTAPLALDLIKVLMI
ncbi:hypothetical protein J6590_062482 [Homalodisca vitripennis]|nr:hypothetical protein J6590_062482 [Homalodisca vitripennis]